MKSVGENEANRFCSALILRPPGTVRVTESSIKWAHKYGRYEKNVVWEVCNVQHLSFYHARQSAGQTWFFFFFCVRCDDRAKSSGRWLLGSPPSAVVRQLAPRAWCPLKCLLAKTVGVLSPGVGRSEECAQEFAPRSHIHSGLNQQDLVSSDVFLAHSDQYAHGRWWFGSSCQGC